MNDKTTKRIIDAHVHISLFDGNAQNLLTKIEPTIYA